MARTRCHLSALGRHPDAGHPAAAEGTLFGIYEQFYRLNSGGTGRQEDFGLKIQHLNTDILSGDILMLELNQQPEDAKAKQ